MAGFTATPPPIATMAQTESDMVEACGRFAQSLGMARSVVLAMPVTDNGRGSIMPPFA